MDLATLRDELRLYLGVDDQDLDDPSALLLLNQSLAELDNKFPFREKEVRLDFDTTIGEPKYQFNAAFEAVVTVSIEDPDSEQKATLDRMTLTTYEASVNNASDYQAAPTNYVRHNDCIILYPTPDNEYAITVMYLKHISDLVSNTDVPGFPTNWHEILLYGAVWRGFLKIGDMNRSLTFKQHQVALITSTVPPESKEEFDTHNGGVEVLGRRGYR